MPIPPIIIGGVVMARGPIGDMAGMTGGGIKSVRSQS